MSALIAEIAKKAHAVIVDKREIRADNWFAVGKLDDFNQDFLGAERDSGNEDCRSYEEWPQMHT
jgi:hypothetical protein